eukprot:1320319-Prymnesium_polylepis.1
MHDKPYGICFLALAVKSERPSWSVAAASWWSPRLPTHRPTAVPAAAAAATLKPHCDFAMSLLLDDVELGQTT